MSPSTRSALNWPPLINRVRHLSKNTPCRYQSQVRPRQLPRQHHGPGHLRNLVSPNHPDVYELQKSLRPSHRCQSRLVLALFVSPSFVHYVTLTQSHDEVALHLRCLQCIPQRKSLVQSLHPSQLVPHKMVLLIPRRPWRVTLLFSSSLRSPIINQPVCCLWVDDDHVVYPQGGPLLLGW
jgi:hypothetical protein